MDQHLRDQLNKIERFAKEAEPYVEGTVLHVRADKLEAMWRLLDSSLFREGGYYYDLRREHEQQKQALAELHQQLFQKNTKEHESP